MDAGLKQLAHREIGHRHGSDLSPVDPPRNVHPVARAPEAALRLSRRRSRGFRVRGFGDGTIPSQRAGF
jgi:hypothetical protein